MPPKKKKGKSAKKKASDHGDGEKVDKSKADMRQKELEQRDDQSKQFNILSMNQVESTRKNNKH